jgi:hypothetical protein
MSCSRFCVPLTSARLSELEYIAFGIVAVADFGALEFPLALGGIYGTT